MFSLNSKQIIQGFKNFKTTNIYQLNLLKKFFNTQVNGGAGTLTPTTQAPPKTKEQLKIEKLMESWPDCVKNPQTVEFQDFKETLEYMFKFHQGDKHYLKYHEIPEEITNVINLRLYSALSTENIASFIKEFNGFLTDEMISYKFLQIALTHQDLPIEFFETVLPEVKKCIGNSDKQCNNILARAVIGGSHLFIGDSEFWINERLYRYLTLEQQVEVAYSLTVCGKKWTTLLKALEVNFIKHRKTLGIRQDLSKLVEFTYRLNGEGSDLLFKALEDPTIQVPGVDNKIPLMNKSKNLQELEYESGNHKQIESKLNH